MKKSAVVIFPGRGSYGKEELGYLGRFHQDKLEFLKGVNEWRRRNNRPTIDELDSLDKYSAAKHAASNNASTLTYACALADFATIDREKYDIVALCGNSLGWYLTLAAAKALNAEEAVKLVDTMGVLMEEKGVGGQLVYPWVDDDWRQSKSLEQAVANALHNGRTAGHAYLSIKLGGLAVLAGDEAGIAAMEKSLPPIDDRFPFRLARHAAFHTPLLHHVSEAALAEFDDTIFQAPDTPMIDGRGAVWTPDGADATALRSYTLGGQITETYDFSKSVEVAIKEFAPDCLILTGPGAGLGGAIGQELIAQQWQGIDGKTSFAKRQKENPFLLAMGRDDQRPLVV